MVFRSGQVLTKKNTTKFALIGVIFAFALTLTTGTFMSTAVEAVTCATTNITNAAKPTACNAHLANAKDYSGFDALPQVYIYPLYPDNL